MRFCKDLLVGLDSLLTQISRGTIRFFMRIVLFGCGMMGSAVAYDLANRHEVTELRLVDIQLSRARKLAGWLKSEKVSTHKLDVSQVRTTIKLISGARCVVSALPYYLNFKLTQACLKAKVNFCDLGGNNEIVGHQLALDQKVRNAGITIIPDCGLAPGMVGILAAGQIFRFDRVESIAMRVGGLPQNPRPPLGYQITWSVAGLINEYVEKCQALRNGQLQLVEPLTELEEIEFSPPFGKLEAFQTSGGAGTLPVTLGGRVANIDYKTIRYPGHCAKMKTLFEIGLGAKSPLLIEGKRVSPRQVLEKLLLRHLQGNEPDVVLARVTVIGEKNRAQKTLIYQLIDYFDPATGLSAMMRCTGFSMAVIALMLARGEITKKGVVPQELCVPVEPYITELKQRGLKITETIQ